MTFFTGIKSIFSTSPTLPEKRSGEECAPTSTSGLGLLGLLGGETTKAKVPVTVNTVLGVGAMLRAIILIAEGLAALDFKILEEKDDIILPAKSHPLYYLVSKKPHTRTTKFIFFRTLIANCLLHGNGYAIILRDDFTDRPTGFLVLPSKFVQLYEDPGNGDYYYIVTSPLVERGYQGFLSRDVIHITTLSLDGITGINVIRRNAETIGVAIASTEYASTYFGNGAHLSGYIKHPGALSPEAVDKVRTGFKRNYGGLKNTGEVGMLDEGMEFKDLAQNPQQSMLIETRKYSVEDISRIFGVPLHLLNAMDRATFNNVEVMDLVFVKYSLRTWAVQIEEEFDTKIFTDSEMKSMTLFTRFDLDSLMRGDTKSRAEFYEKMFSVGAYSPNDIRRKENENPRVDGDKYFTPLNFTSNPDAAQKPKENEEEE